jgi:predicted metal-dependent hydrolase
MRLKKKRRAKKMDNLPVKVIRSHRRKKTISARVSKGELLIYLPGKMSKKEEDIWVEKMKQRVVNRVGGVSKNDEELKKRAQLLNRRYFDGELKINSIVFSDKQKKRFGSCTTSLGSIRISRRLSAMPNWVLDYVLIHELAHLIVPDHSKSFWDLVNRFKYSERARGFLIARGLEEDKIDSKGSNS